MSNLTRNVIGLDLGKQADFSALALLEWQVPVYEDLARWSPLAQAPKPPPKVLKPNYSVPTLKRWPLGTPYLKIADGLVKFLEAEPLASSCPLLVVDATGVGDAVCEMIREKLLDLLNLDWGMVGVSITAGSRETLVGPGRWNVAKKALVSNMQVTLGERRLHVAPDLAEAQTLIRELGTFTVKITESANESFESWRERDHDDLVLAVALAVWAAESLPWPPVPEELEVTVLRP